MALRMGERGSRDEGIIKLLLYFFRNVAMIFPLPNMQVEGKEDDISRSATIEAFHRQDVLALILTISSNIGEDFNSQDTVIMEILFHLLKGIDIERLFMDKVQIDARNTDELQSLLATEAGMHRNYLKNAPSRHNRFGTMIWVKRDDARLSTVSGQDSLMSKQRTLSKMDDSKKWNKPKQRSKNTEPGFDRFDLPISLSEPASGYLRAFVEEFLDSGFNPLFTHIRKSVERESDRVLDFHAQQFFYLISWFLEAERVRRKKKKEANKKNKSLETFEADSFALVASVLNQETFISLNRFMQERLDLKLWRELNAGMRCFTQILLIVQEMSESPVEEDQEIAENIQNRIFYEETTHDKIIAILRGYKDQGFGYLDSCTELSYVFLRMLERYSKENVDLQVRSRRRARVKQKAASPTTVVNGDEDSEMEDEGEEGRVSKERKFDFGRFSSKFVTQACTNTFVSFIEYYNDLNTEQLKRAHRFFYRVAFKQELSVILFRLDIVALFHKMIKGPQGLDPAGPMFREWDELVRQLFKIMIKKLQQRPELAVELLFSKINSTLFFLENGYEKQAISSKPRPPATLQIKGAMTKDEQIGVAVAVLHDTKIDAADWIVKVLSSAASHRKSWEAEAAARRLAEDPSLEGSDESQSLLKAPPIGKFQNKDLLAMHLMKKTVVTPDNEERRMAMFKDNKLRLLMTLAGFERLGVEDEPATTWIIPSAITARELYETQGMIEKHSSNPVTEYCDEDNQLTAEEMLRRAPSQKKPRVEYDDDSEDNGIVADGEEEFLFRSGGPTETNKRFDALDKLKKKRRKRMVKGDEDGGISEDTRKSKRKAKLAADREKMRKMKSQFLVRESDEESNEELDRAFFAGEEALRRAQALKAGDVSVISISSVLKKSKKRKSRANEDGRSNNRKKQRGESGARFDTEDDDMGGDDDDSSSRRRRANHLALGNSDDDDDTGGSQTSSSKGRTNTTRTLNVGSDDDDDGDMDASLSNGRRTKPAAIRTDSDSDADSDADDDGNMSAPQSSRAKPPFLDIDSDDEISAPLSKRTMARKPAIPLDGDSDSDDINTPISSRPRVTSSRPTALDDSSEDEATSSSRPRASKPAVFVDISSDNGNDDDLSSKKKKAESSAALDVDSDGDDIF